MELFRTDQSGLPVFLQRDPRTQRDRALAEILQDKASTSTGPVGSVAEGSTRALARILSAFGANRLNSRADERISQRQDAFNETFQKAATAEDVQGLVSALLGSPDTAPFGLQLRLSELQRQQGLEDNRTTADQRAARDQELARVRAGVNRLTFETLTSEDEVALFGEDRPGSFQRGSDNKISQITGSARTEATKTTPAQTANNAEIRAARARIRALTSEVQPGGTLRQLLIERSKSASSTGRENQLFDPQLAADFKIAKQAMVGGDDDFDRFFKDLRTPTAAAPAPHVPPPAPGFLESVGNFFTGGPETPAQASTPGSATPEDARPKQLQISQAPTPTTQPSESQSFQPGSSTQIDGRNFQIVRQNPDGTFVVRDALTGQEFRAGL